MSVCGYSASRASLRSPLTHTALSAGYSSRYEELAGVLCGQVLNERTRREGLQRELEQQREAVKSFGLYVSEWERLLVEATGTERARLEDEWESYRTRLAGANDTVKTLEAELA